MRRYSTEAKVGLFFVLVFLLIGYISTRLGNYGISSRGTHRLSAVFRTAAGLNQGINVLLAGIKIGYVESQELEGVHARVHFVVNGKVNIPKDSLVSVQSHGFLGQKYLEITPGKSRTDMKDGDEFTNVSDSSDISVLTSEMESVAKDVKSITGSLRNVFGTEEGEEGLRQIFESLNTITASLADTLEANQRRMDAIIANVERFSGDMAYLSAKNREDISRTMAAFPAIAENLRAISGNMANILDNNNEDIKQTLANLVGVTENLSKSLEAFSSIAHKIDEGQGTVGKLVNDEKTIDSINEAVEGINDYLGRVRKLQVEVGYRGEYEVQQGQLKSYFNINIKPRFDKIYMLSLIDAPAGRTNFTRIRTKTTTNPGAADEDITNKVEEKHVTTDQLLVSAQIAKRWHDLLFRGGIIENHGGLGIEYYLWNDHINFAFEAFDFASSNNPHLKGYVNGFFLDHFLLTAGIDDFINKYDQPRYFIGAGLYFTDQDITYLATKVPTSVP